MRIGILTHPQGKNYGGILQCYALSEVLKSLGHEPIVIQRKTNRQPILRRIAHHVLEVVRRIRGQHRREGTEKILPFVDSYLKRTVPVTNPRQMKNICNQYKLDAVVVGSDQVWRRDFAINFGYEFFLDFAPKGVIKLSYAASFGLSNWQYTPEETLRIKSLLSEYVGISVREDEAVSLCKKQLGLDVEQMADPTLLLNPVDYDKISSHKLADGNYVFVYWLGEDNQIRETISEYEKNGCKIIYIGLREQRQMPSVGDWISYVKYADKVITDSFHCCVFAILYHRPLQVFENKSGGYGRIVSLFQSLNLDAEKVSVMDEKDCQAAELCLAKMREKSYSFLKEHIV